MSTNIHFIAEREIIVKRTGKVDVQTQNLHVLQTRTPDTYKIINSADPKLAYIEYVLTEFDHDEQEPVYAEDDVFCERDPVGFKTFNAGKDHVAEFLQIIEQLEAEGYEIRAEAR